MALARTAAADANRQKQVAQAQTQIAQAQTQYARQQADVAARQRQAAQLAQGKTKVALLSARQSALLSSQRAVALVAANRQKQSALTEAQQQRQIALNSLADAKAQTLRANGQKQIAQAAGHNEKQARLASEHLRYVSDMQLAAQSWADGNPNTAEALLNAHTPGSPSDSDSKDQRDFAWRYQWGLMHRDTATFVGPDAPPDEGAFTADGSLLTIDDDGEKLTRWNTITHRATSTKPLQFVDGLLSPDGRSLLVFDQAGRLALVDPTTLKARFELIKSAATVTAATFDPTGHYLAVVSQANIAEIWDATTGQVVHKPHAIRAAGSRPVSACPFALTPDGSTLLFAGLLGPGHITLFHAAEDFKETDAVLPSTAPIGTVACSPDGKLFASGDSAGNIFVRDMSFHPVAPRLAGEGQRSNVYQLAFSPDSRTLAAGGRDGSLRLWNVPEGTLQRALLGHFAGVTFINWRADGKALAAGSFYGTTTVWNTDTASGLEVMPFRVQPWGSVFSPDGRWLAAIEQTGQVVLWNRRTAQIECRLPGPQEHADSLAFTPDGRTLAVGTGDRQIQFWNPMTHRLSRTWKMPSRYEQCSIGSIDISHDGNLLAARLVTRENGSRMIAFLCAVWNLRTGGLLATLPGASALDTTVRFSPDSRMLAVTGGQDNRVWEWRVGAWNHPYRTFAGPDVSDASPVVVSLAYSPDGRILAAGGFSGQIGLYDPRTGILLRRLTGHTDAIWDLNFSPDGRLLASASHDHTVKLWDVAGCREVHTFTAYTDVALKAVFAPDGDCLATQSRDSLLRLWTAPALPAIDAQRRDVTREYLPYQARQAQNQARQAQKLALPALRPQQRHTARTAEARQPGADQMFPLMLTGYNQDVIAEKEPGQTNSLDNSLRHTTTATVDTLTDFYAPGFNPRFPKVGLPAGTQFASRDDPLISFALQPASRNNVLLLSAGSAQSAGGVLALTHPARFTSLAFLVAGFNGPRSGVYRLDFADGHSSAGTFIAPDNFDVSAAHVAVGGFGRVFRIGTAFTAPSGALPDGQFENCQPDNPNLFGIPMTLSAADAERTLVRIAFTNRDKEGSGGNVSILGIFGVSGHAAPEGLSSPGKSQRGIYHAEKPVQP